MGSIGKVIQRADTIPTADVQAVVDYANTQHPDSVLTVNDWRVMEAAQAAYFIGRIAKQVTPRGK